MNLEKVQLTVSSIIDLLNNGYTWFKKDDLGYGSIQEKFQATDVQVHTIRKHPALKDADTTAKIFIIIDDTKNNETASQTNQSTPVGASENTPREEVPVVAEPAAVETSAATVDSFEAFASL